MYRAQSVSYIGEYTGVSLDSCQVAAASPPAALQHCSMPPPAAPSPLFSLVPCGDKGLGLVADTDLGPGTLLVSEAAVLRVTLFNGDLSSGASKDVSRQFSRYVLFITIDKPIHIVLLEYDLSV